MHNRGLKIHFKIIPESILNFKIIIQIFIIQNKSIINKNYTKEKVTMNNAPYRKILILNAVLLIKYALYSNRIT